MFGENDSLKLNMDNVRTASNYENEDETSV